MASNASRPRILITRAEDVPGQRWDDYAESVANAGGEPIEGALDAAHNTPEHDGLLQRGQLRFGGVHAELRGALAARLLDAERVGQDLQPRLLACRKKKRPRKGPAGRMKRGPGREAGGR